MSIINCFNCAVVNIPQKSSSRMPHKSCRTEASCETGLVLVLVVVVVAVAVAVAVTVAVAVAAVILSFGWSGTQEPSSHQVQSWRCKRLKA